MGRICAFCLRRFLQTKDINIKIWDSELQSVAALKQRLWYGRFMHAPFSAIPPTLIIIALYI